MNKIEFYNQLRQSLKNFNEMEVNKIVEYYDELIEEKKDVGMTEEEAVASFGDIKSIINTVTADLVMERIENNDKKTVTNFFIILGICASPILLPIGIAFFSIFLSFFIVIFSFVLSFSISAFAVLISIIPTAIKLNSTGANLSEVLISIGTLLTVSGLFMILTIASYKVGSYGLNLINKSFSKLIKNRTKGDKL